MKTQTLIVTLGLVSFGLAAWSHSGATGIVKERMDGMSAMSRVIKDLTPMMRGNVDYDAQQVRDAADVMISHAGDQMTSLFPEGTGRQVTGRRREERQTLEANGKIQLLRPRAI